MTTTSEPLLAATNEWRAAADRVLQIAEAAAPLPGDTFEGLSFGEEEGDRGEAAPEEVVDARVDDLLRSSDALIDQLGGEGPEAAAAAIPVLLGTIEVGTALLAASQDRDDAFATLGVDDSTGRVSLTGSRLVLNEFEAAILGSPVEPVELPPSVVKKLEALETAGGDELVAIAKDATLRQALGYAASAAIGLGGDKVNQAFEWVKREIGWLRRRAVKVLQWVVAKFRSLVPEQFREKFDAKLNDLQDKLKDGIPSLVGDLLGRLFGRAEAEENWLRAKREGKDMSGPEGKLDGVISGQLKRIGYVSTGRKASSTASAIVVGFFPAAVAQVQIVVGALAVTMAAFVSYQVWDGFNDIENLIPA